MTSAFFRRGGFIFDFASRGVLFGWLHARRVISLFALAAFASGGCGTWYSGLQGNTSDVSGAYASALQDHTRRGWRIKGFDNLVSVTATIQTKDFARILHAEQTRLLASPVEADVDAPNHPLFDRNGVSVVLFIEALEPAWERLDRAESNWRIFLEVDGIRHEPARIAPLDTRDAMLGHFFPYVTRFGRPWLLTFPLESTGTQPVLWMIGAPAQLRLEFDL